MGEQRWIVVAQDHPRYPWAVRDQAGTLGDLWQRHRGQAERIARDRNRRLPWPDEAARDAPHAGEGAEGP